MVSIWVSDVTHVNMVPSDGCVYEKFRKQEIEDEGG